MFPKAVQVMPMADYSVYVYFEDGKIVHYDMSQMVEKEAFCLLKEIEIFVDRCTVMKGYACMGYQWKLGQYNMP